MRCTGNPPPVLAARFFRVRAMSKPVPRTTPHLDLRQNPSAWIIRMVQDRARRTKERTGGKKGSRTPTDAGLPACLAASAHPAGRARLSAFHGGSALGTH